eukprot:CAMPEP_0198535272 /NCGR_PEP_ID=MMETSP1462-20131121/38824_1 /TAXON_ID=1333877 /ORGANISM="Brandtodinium nutriculum, Strain RCC3387" /LENGTH=55 /DNA_ID=CAMNT_0044265209 /DNA_START=11 /DNA_END=175 /DNA_ORIENTATION=+
MSMILWKSSFKTLAPPTDFTTLPLWTPAKKACPCGSPGYLEVGMISMAMAPLPPC